MFQPTLADVRRFFCAVYSKSRADAPMEPMEVLAAGWMDEHPEYHADLADAEAAIQRIYPAADGRSNPFLHLSMHLSISEQCSIDQPRGIRQAIELLGVRLNSLHAAHHVAMDCLGQMLQESQRSGQPPDGESYVACILRKATRG